MRFNKRLIGKVLRFSDVSSSDHGTVGTLINTENNNITFCLQKSDGCVLYVPSRTCSLFSGDFIPYKEDKIPADTLTPAVEVEDSEEDENGIFHCRTGDKNLRDEDVDDEDNDKMPSCYGKLSVAEYEVLNVIKVDGEQFDTSSNELKTEDCKVCEAGVYHCTIHDSEFLKTCKENELKLLTPKKINYRTQPCPECGNLYIPMTENSINISFTCSGCGEMLKFNKDFKLEKSTTGAVYSEESNPDDIQVGGTHYGSFDIWKLYDHNQHLTAYDFNALKYIFRYRKKDGLEDLEKAKHYLEKIIKEYKKQLKEEGK